MDDDDNEGLLCLELEALDLTIRFMHLVGWSKERIELHVELQCERIRKGRRYDTSDYSDFPASRLGFSAHSAS